MRKTIFSLLATILILAVLASCSSRQDTPEKDSPSKSNSQSAETDGTIKHTGVKIDGTITQATEFSEGLAFVQCGDKNKTYCINKQGYIVFELDVELEFFRGEEFTNGLAYMYMGGGICDTKGKLTYPEDVGATEFYPYALSGGYILAEKVTSDYSSTKKELGVMNRDFKWIIEPSEELYNAVEENLGFRDSSNYFDDYIYFKESEVYLNLKTGELSDTISKKLPSQTWAQYSDNTYRDNDENILLDLREYENMFLSYGSTFINGKAAVCFNNRDANKSYFTIIDEKGEFQFEPVAVQNMSKVAAYYFDGQNIVMVDNAINTETIVCYNIKGEFLGSLNPQTLGYMSYSCNIADGVILVKGGYNFSNKYYFYNPDFTPLF